MLKTVFKIGLVLLLAALFPRNATAIKNETETGKPAQDPAALVDYMVDYVATDYPAAVQDGRVVDESEYTEQKNLLDEAAKLAADVTGADAEKPRLVAAIQAVRAALENKEPAAEVLSRCQAVRRILKDSFHLKMVPKHRVSVAQAQSLYQTQCSVCHGADGRAKTEAAKNLTPPPLSFFDAEKMPKLAPQLAFHVLTFGISGTGMPSFDHLSAEQRWALSFYVVGLRHGSPGQKTDAVLGRHPIVSRVSLADLAEQSDEALCKTLVDDSLKPNECAAALSFLRTQAPFATEHAGALRFDDARALLQEVKTALAKGDAATAKRLAISAYLDGVEPNEARLRVEQPERLREIEAVFLALRQAIPPEPPTAEDTQAIEKHMTKALALLAQAEEGSTGTVAAFLASFTIAVREGLEIALLIAALLAYLRKSGQAHMTQYVHVGWLLSIPAGVLTFLAVGALLTGAQRELAEGIMSLLAAVILITMTHWIIGAKEAQQWLGFLRRKIETASGQTGALQKFLLVSLSFLAVYREAVEVVLFYRTLLLSAGPSAKGEVLWGATLGVGVIFVVVFVVGKIGKRLNPRPVMLASGLLLLGLALAMTGNGVHALQEAGVLDATPIASWAERAFSVPMLGIYPTRQVLLAQVAVFVLVFLPSIAAKLSTHRAARAA